MSYPPVNGWSPPSAHYRKRILDEAKTIAIVGASANRSRASNFVITYLKSSICDYDLFPINPSIDEILDLQVYQNLASVPRPIDVVNVFRRAEDCPEIARQAVEVEAKVLWLQLGIWSVESAEIALAGGLDVVMNRCTKIEHARFAGGLHLAGFNTGVLSSRRAK